MCKLTNTQCGRDRTFLWQGFHAFYASKILRRNEKKKIKICFSSGVSLRRCRVLELEKDEVGMGILEI